MKRLLLAAGALLATALPVVAGDLPLQRQNYYQPNVANTLFNWTGFYVGGSAGYSWGSSIGGNTNGFIGGVQAGYNFQVSPSVVFGAETDISYTSADEKRGGAKFSADYLGTIRTRLGYSLDRVMFYATAGLAYGGGELSAGGLTNDQSHWGWTIGAGVETMLTRNISAKLEYLYVDLNDQTYRSILGPRSVGYDTSIIRTGVNYKF